MAKEKLHKDVIEETHEAIAELQYMHKIIQISPKKKQQTPRIESKDIISNKSTTSK